MNKYLTHRMKLILSLFGGGLVALMVWWHLNQSEQRLNARYESAIVLVTKKYIPMGKEIRPDMVEEKKIPIAFIQPTAIKRWEDLKDAQGRPNCKTRIELLKGEQLTRSKMMEGDGSLGLAWNLSPDLQAVSFRLEPNQAIGGHIKPGDWVSVWAAFDQQPGVSEPQAVLVLTHCQVVGIQDHLWNLSGGPEEKIDWKALLNDGILVTLSINPGEVGKVLLAETKGRLMLALYSGLSQQVEHQNRIRFSQLIKE